MKRTIITLLAATAAVVFTAQAFAQSMPLKSDTQVRHFFEEANKTYGGGS